MQPGTENKPHIQQVQALTPDYQA